MAVPCIMEKSVAYAADFCMLIKRALFASQKI